MQRARLDRHILPLGNQHQPLQQGVLVTRSKRRHDPHIPACLPLVRVNVYPFPTKFNALLRMPGLDQQLMRQPEQSLDTVGKHTRDLLHPL